MAAIGAGVAVHGGMAAMADELGPAIERVLHDPELRSGAARIAADIAALPPVADAVPVVERLVAR